MLIFITALRVRTSTSARHWPGVGFHLDADDYYWLNYRPTFTSKQTANAALFSVMYDQSGPCWRFDMEWDSNWRTLSI